ncbi:MAG: hypothetical protein NVS3B26_21870 [Mycobacteriales bacterium]
MGAFQVGALGALLDAGIAPDALYGCSAGALNAAFWACRPDRARAAELERWWADPAGHMLLSPSWRTGARSVGAALRSGGRGLLHNGMLRRLIEAELPVHDLSELAVPMMLTTTCLDCAAARWHEAGPIADLLAASCALPGLFAPVQIDGHWHVDGGVLAGVPVRAALAKAAPQDRILVLDCGLAPVTGRVDSCAALSPVLSGRACGLVPAPGRAPYVAPVESCRSALQVVLKAFTVARAVANRAEVTAALDDPRVLVLPHVADAWVAGLLPRIPAGPRDFTGVIDLLAAGRAVTQAWLQHSSGLATR